MKQRVIDPILIIFFIGLVSGVVILYGRGYRLDFKKKELKTTGLLAVTSSPSGASILINGRLTSATSDTINLEPGFYNVRLLKEGHIPWEKKIEIKKEIVAQINATLFPSNPSLSPFTSTGAKAPSLSADGSKIAYIVPYQTIEEPNQTPDKYGVFILSLNGTPLSFSRKPNQIFAYRILPSEKISLLWSPDGTQLLFLGEKAAFLLDVVKRNEFPPNLIGTLPSLFETWEKETQELAKRKLLQFPKTLIEFFTSSARILSFSPDEGKILYEGTASAKISPIIEPPLLATNPTAQTREVEPDKVYVYDQKEDRNYKIEINYSSLQWLPTSRHLILIEEDKISMLEYDGTNKATIFASPFEESFAAPFPDASKLVILTSLNPATTTLPNLYTLSLK